MKVYSHKKGFTLFIALVVMSLLLLIAFAIINIAVKESLLSASSRDSQVAFYAADSGIECALYWDLKNPEGSAFSTQDIQVAGPPSSTIIIPRAISCNDQYITSGSQGNIPDGLSGTESCIGMTDQSPCNYITGNTSVFYLQFDEELGDDGRCAIVTVEKRDVGSGAISTIIESKGYNTCNVESSRRIERAIRVTTS